MNQRVEVIHNTCRKSYHTNSFMVTGDAARTFYTSVDEARSYADPLRGRGQSVIIRPQYNEPSAAGSYREWRSFDGEEFKEVWF